MEKVMLHDVTIQNDSNLQILLQTTVWKQKNKKKLKQIKCVRF